MLKGRNVAKRIKSLQKGGLTLGQVLKRMKFEPYEEKCEFTLTPCRIYQREDGVIVLRIGNGQRQTQGIIL